MLAVITKKCIVIYFTVFQKVVQTSQDFRSSGNLYFFKNDFMQSCMKWEKYTYQQSCNFYQKITGKTNSVYVCGPTGFAAFNAGGETCHQLFNI